MRQRRQQHRLVARAASERHACHEVASAAAVAAGAAAPSSAPAAASVAVAARAPAVAAAALRVLGVMRERQCSARSRAALAATRRPMSVATRGPMSAATRRSTAAATSTSLAASGGGMLASFRPPRPAPEPGSCADGVAIMTLGGAPAAPPIGGGRVRIGERTASSSGGSAPVSGGGAGAAPVLDNAAGIALAIDGGSARGRCDGVLEARAGSWATADTSCATCE